MQIKLVYTVQTCMSFNFCLTPQHASTLNTSSFSLSKCFNAFNGLIIITLSTRAPSLERILYIKPILSTDQRQLLLPVFCLELKQCSCHRYITMMYKHKLNVFSHSLKEHRNFIWLVIQSLRLLANNPFSKGIKSLLPEYIFTVSNL